jgi:hypothetical protein
VHLLLGNPEDPCLLGVRNVLESRGHPTLTIANPLAHPSRLVWRLDGDRSESRIAWNDESTIPDAQIEGVVVRSTAWIDPAGWQRDDLIYMQSETHAALLAWLWSLPCPVVNRYPSALWYRPQMPLLAWQRLLRRCGIPVMDTLVTNVESDAREFRRHLARNGVAGAVYGPLTGNVRYLVTGDEEWDGLVALQNHAPVCLAAPHGAALFVCVVGGTAVWGREPSPEAAVLEPALLRFAAAAGLAFVELALAPTAQDICAIAVEPYPDLVHFESAARQKIVEAIADLLAAEAATHRADAKPALERSFG